jgi:GNAT superfamily N-acetyltransferase
MIEIRPLNAAQLNALVQSPEYANWPHLPISRHRGLSHIHNPRAQADDPLLLLAYDDGEPGRMVGYLGVMPDTIHLPNGKHIEMAWMSCIWVDASQRGKGISKLLTRKAFELYEGRILLTEFTEVAGKLYDRLDLFDCLHISEGKRLYHRLDLHGILVSKGGKWLKIKPLLKIADILGNALLDLRFLRNPKPAGWTIEQALEVDQEAATFISQHNGTEWFRRQAKELNWMLEWPWMLSGSTGDAMSRKYEFSSVAHFFQNDLLKVRDASGTLRMVLFFSRRDRTLKLNYCYFDPGLADSVLDILRYQMRKWKINTALIYHDELVKALENKRIGVLFQKPARREYRIGKELGAVVVGGEFRIQDGDGDCGFT